MVSIATKAYLSLGLHSLMADGAIDEAHSTRVACHHMTTRREKDVFVAFVAQEARCVKKMGRGRGDEGRSVQCGTVYERG